MGEVLLGSVGLVTPYGAFISIGDGVRGLLHISQISQERIATMDGLFTVGDKIKARAARPPPFAPALAELLLSSFCALSALFLHSF